MKKNIPQKIEKILENLRLQRIQKGYSQEYLGEQLGLTQYAYHRNGFDETAKLSYK